MGPAGGNLTRGRAAVLVVAALLVGGFVGYRSVEGAVAERAAQDTAVAAAQPVAQLCDTGRRDLVEDVGGSCESAYQVVRSDGATNGEDGEDGRGVRSLDITAAGRLVVTYTDGETTDLGPVVGAPGAVGPEGRGIADISMADGRLIVVYTDGARVDVGLVRGDPGRGIASVDQVDGRLIITYTTGETQDAGPLPPGEPGAEGPPGPTCRAPYVPVETGEVAGADGRVYARSITCVDPDSQVPPDAAPASTPPAAAPPASTTPEAEPEPTAGSLLEGS